MKRSLSPSVSRWWLAAGCAAALSPVAASAHFVWAEPAVDSTGGVRVFFGEYPGTREGAELLEKVSRVRVYAVGRGERRELKRTRQEGDHFLYQGMGDAPVMVGALDYGVLERPGTPAFMLRYETQLLIGDGKPQSTAGLSQLSKAETGLPLTVSFVPTSADKLTLQVTLAGKPAAAEVSHRGPKDDDMVAAKTTADGRLELPLKASGWHHLRIKADDAKPVSHAGKEAKFTRTYLSLMFNAALDPAAAPRAAVQPNAEAVSLLRAAHEARANWRPGFPGFTADAVYQLNGKEARGTITVKSDFTIEYGLGDKELETALRPSFASLIMHRRGGGAPEYQGTWRDEKPHLLGRAINLNDQLGSFYRIRDRQILEVNRVIGSQRFTNTVLENETTKLGFLPRAWSVAYYEKDSNKLLRTSTTQVSWAWKGDIFLPATLQTVVAHDEGTDVSRLELTNHRLLK
ncbi:MAG: DUF3386 family protein [Actinomycetota bacterium]